MTDDPLADYRRRNAGKTITWVVPGELLTDADGNPLGMTPNVTSTVRLDDDGHLLPPDYDDED